LPEDETVTFLLEPHPIDPAALRAQLASPDCGGFVFFEGRVRDHHEGRVVTGLHYEAYRELAEKEGRRLVDEIAAKHGVRAAAVHATGTLVPGDLAVWVGAAAAHRDAAFAACRELIDSIKERVPIWKQETYADGPSEWVEGCACGAGPDRARRSGP
jgi:molybdopterin synthase catalytic subunit